MVTSTRLQGFLGQGMTYENLFFFPREKKGSMLTASGTKHIPQPRLGRPPSRQEGERCSPSLWDGCRRCCHAQENLGQQLSVPTMKQRLFPPSCTPVMTLTG